MNQAGCKIRLQNGCKLVSNIRIYYLTKKISAKVVAKIERLQICYDCKFTTSIAITNLWSQKMYFLLVLLVGTTYKSSTKVNHFEEMI